MSTINEAALKKLIAQRSARDAKQKQKEKFAEGVGRAIIARTSRTSLLSITPNINCNAPMPV